MCTCTLDDSAREKLGLATAGLNSILSLIGAITVCVAIYMKIRIEDRVLMLGAYTGSAFTDYLIATGCLVLLINGFVAKVSFDCATGRNRQMWLGILLVLVIILFILSILVLTAAILCYQHHEVIDKALELGFFKAMRKYKSEPAVKTELDILQMDFRCCGADAYTDWFHISWVHKNYINTSDSRIINKMYEDGYRGDDVPFSCCDISALRPCIHHSMTHSSHHPSFNRETIHTNGCNKVLEHYFQHKVFGPMGHLSIAAFCLEVIVTVLLRVFQTAVITAIEYGDSDGPGQGYVCNSCPNCCCSLPDSDTEYRGGGGGGGGRGGRKDKGKKDKDKKKSKKDKDKKKDRKGKEKKKDSSSKSKGKSSSKSSKSTPSKRSKR